MKTLMLLLLASSTAINAPEPKLDEATRWLATRIVSSATYDQLKSSVVENRLMLVFTAANNRLANYAPVSPDPLIQVVAGQRRGQLIAEILAKDLNNDGVVTRGELEVAFERQSQLSLLSTYGLRVKPTPEQSAEVLKHIVELQLAPDINHNGTITFDEMRAFAARFEKPERYDNDYASRLVDPSIVTAIDTSRDGKISPDEFRAAIRATFALIDTDKDGVLSPVECQPFRRSSLDTRF